MVFESKKLEAFMSKMVGHMTGGAICYSIWPGDELGLYREMANSGPRTADSVAEKTGCNPRVVREWLDGQAAGGLVAYEASADTYELGPEAHSRSRMKARPSSSPEDEYAGLDVHGHAEDGGRVPGHGAMSWGDHHPCLSPGPNGSSELGTGAPFRFLDSGSRRCRSEAQGRRVRCRRRLWPRCVGGGDGRRLPEARRFLGSTSTRLRSRPAARGHARPG